MILNIYQHLKSDIRKIRNIHHFDMFSTFPIRHPEIPKIHHFDNFSHFPDLMEFNYLGTIQCEAKDGLQPFHFVHEIWSKRGDNTEAPNYG